jgi:hypothetical protein
MDALPAKNILTRRANQWHHYIIAQFVKPPMALPIEIAVTVPSIHSGSAIARSSTAFRRERLRLALIKP